MNCSRPTWVSCRSRRDPLAAVARDRNAGPRVRATTLDLNQFARSRPPPAGACLQANRGWHCSAVDRATPSSHRHPAEQRRLLEQIQRRGRPACVIETVVVEIVPFEDVSAEFAAGEGEASLESWRRAHWAYFGRECARLGREPTPTMPVVCERFKVVYRGIP